MERTGPLKAAIFDWAGTTVDYGSRAPANAFLELFRRHKVDLTVEQARGPMGLHKKEHIRQIVLLEAVAARWKMVRGQPPSEADVDHLYEEFVPLQIEVLARHTDLIPGTIQAVADLRQRSMKIGSTTGYTGQMMEALAKEAARQGFLPDVTVCADQVPEGRPAPWMCLTAAMRLGVYPLAACVKIGDTPADILEGLNAGMWTMGVTKTGNELGLSADELAALAPEDLEARLEAASRRLHAAGAHFVVESVADVPRVVDEINARLARGHRP